MNYLWVYILTIIAILSLGFFLATFSKDMYLTRKLKLKKTSLWLNFSLLLISLMSLGLIIYLFSSLKEQIQFFS